MAEIEFRPSHEDQNASGKLDSQGAAEFRRLLVTIGAQDIHMLVLGEETPWTSPYASVYKSRSFGPISSIL